MDIATLLTATPLKPLQDRYTDPKLTAQNAMEGWSHYFDDGSMRFFGSRVLKSAIVEGVILVSLESQKAGPDPSAGRAFRVSVFDLTGRMLNDCEGPWPSHELRASRRDAGNAYSDAVMRARDIWREVLDAALEREAAKDEREAAALRDALATLRADGGAA